MSGLSPPRAPRISPLSPPPVVEESLHRSLDRDSQVRNFEELCSAATNANNPNRTQAESELTRLKLSHFPYSFCMNVFILSSNGMAQFQAALIMREAFLREWNSLSVDLILKLRSGIVEEILKKQRKLDEQLSKMDRGGSSVINNGVRCALESFVLNAYLRLLSILYKRVWFGDEKKNISLLLQSIRDLVWPQSTADIRGEGGSGPIESRRSLSLQTMRIGLVFAQFIIEEFSIHGSSTPLGVTLDFHLECHESFEKFVLPAVFEMILPIFEYFQDSLSDMQRGLSELRLPSDSDSIDDRMMLESLKQVAVVVLSDSFDSRTCAALCSLAQSMISFEFHELMHDGSLLLKFDRSAYSLTGDSRSTSSAGRSSGIGSGGGSSAVGTLANNSQLMRPGPKWREQLVDSMLVESLVKFHNTLYQLTQILSSPRLSRLFKVSFAGSVMSSDVSSSSMVASPERTRQMLSDCLQTLSLSSRSVREVFSRLCLMNGHIFDEPPSAPPLSSLTDGSTDGDSATPVRKSAKMSDGSLRSVSFGMGGLSLSTSPRRVVGRDGFERERELRVPFAQRLCGALLSMAAPAISKIDSLISEYRSSVAGSSSGSTGSLPSSVRERICDMLDDDYILNICRLFGELVFNYKAELLFYSFHFFLKTGFFQTLSKLATLLISLIPNDVGSVETWTNEGLDELIEAVIQLIGYFESRHLQFAGDKGGRGGGASIKAEDVITDGSGHTADGRLVKSTKAQVLGLLANMTRQLYQDFVQRLMEMSHYEIVHTHSAELSTAEDSGADGPSLAADIDVTGDSGDHFNAQTQFADALYLDSRLTSFAMIARINAMSVLPFLCKESMIRIRQIKSASESVTEIRDGDKSSVKISVIHEQLGWLLQFLIYALADECMAGETPTIPHLLMPLCKADSPEEMPPLLKAVQPLLIWTRWENECLIKHTKKSPSSADSTSISMRFISPFLADISARLLRRWAATYLMPSVAFYSSVRDLTASMSVFGSESEHSKNSLNFLIEKATLNIFHWQSEAATVGGSSVELLKLLARIKNVRPSLRKCPAFQRLVSDYLEGGDVNPARLPMSMVSPVVCAIVQLFVHSVTCPPPASEMPDSYDGTVSDSPITPKTVFDSSELCSSKEALTLICRPIAKYASDSLNSISGLTTDTSRIRELESGRSGTRINSVGGGGGFRNNRQIRRIAICLHLLRGVVQSNIDEVFGWISQFSVALINCISEFSTEIDMNIVLNIFEIFADISECYLPFIAIDSKECNEYLKACLTLIIQFDLHNRMRDRQLLNEFIKSDTRQQIMEMQVCEFRAILRLLKYVSEKEMHALVHLTHPSRHHHSHSHHSHHFHMSDADITSGIVHSDDPSSSLSSSHFSTKKHHRRSLPEYRTGRIVLRSLILLIPHLYQVDWDEKSFDHHGLRYADDESSILQSSRLMLKYYPDLCCDFYELLSVCIANFIDRLSILDFSEQNKLLKETIPYGLNHTHERVMNYSLDIINHLCLFHIKSHRQSKFDHLINEHVPYLFDLLMGVDTINDNDDRIGLMMMSSTTTMSDKPNPSGLKTSTDLLRKIMNNLSDSLLSLIMCDPDYVKKYFSNNLVPYVKKAGSKEDSSNTERQLKKLQNLFDSLLNRVMNLMGEGNLHEIAQDFKVRKQFRTFVLELSGQVTSILRVK